MAPIINNNQASSIAMALAGMTDAVEIPKPKDNHNFWTGKDSFAAVAARSLPTKGHHAGLPTPPNSISPSLPPQAFQSHDTAAPPTPPAQALADSDIDLQDAVDHAQAQDQPQRGLALAPGNGNLAGLDTAGAITPGLLAKHHLPEILLNHGPLAIRHVMGYLTTSVPGFSGIPPAKARRLVVGALEGRGNGGEAGGLQGDVQFEKVGWGRWDARRNGHPSRHDRSTRRSSPTLTRHSRRSPSPYATSSVHIPRTKTIPTRSRLPPSRTLLTHQSLQSLDPDAHVRHETEADKMSLDDASCSSSEVPEEEPILEEDLGDVTDEEDWASIGAAALRAGSLPSGSGGGRIYSSSSTHTNYGRRIASGHVHKRDRGVSRGPVTRTLAKSVPMGGLGMMGKTGNAFTNLGRQQQLYHMGGRDVMEGIASDSQEREAIEALVRLSSV